MTGPPEAGSEAGAAVAEARRWLSGRMEDAPARLARAVEGAIDRLPPARDEQETEAPWDLMARAAVHELEAVRPDAGDRDAAVHLLAADALLTYAFQCAAEEGADLRAMAERWGARGRLGEALERARRAAAGGGEP